MVDPTKANNSYKVQKGGEFGFFFDAPQIPSNYNFSGGNEEQVKSKDKFKDEDGVRYQLRDATKSEIIPAGENSQVVVMASRNKLRFGHLVQDQKNELSQGLSGKSFQFFAGGVLSLVNLLLSTLNRSHSAEGMGDQEDEKLETYPDRDELLPDNNPGWRTLIREQHSPSFCVTIGRQFLPRKNAKIRKTWSDPDTIDEWCLAKNPLYFDEIDQFESFISKLLSCFIYMLPMCDLYRACYIKLIQTIREMSNTMIEAGASRQQAKEMRTKFFEGATKGDENYINLLTHLAVTYGIQDFEGFKKSMNTNLIYSTLVDLGMQFALDKQLADIELLDTCGIETLDNTDVVDDSPPIGKRSTPFSPPPSSQTLLDD